jgi:hypothetical protein
MSKRSTNAQLWKTGHIGPIHAVAFFVSLPQYAAMLCVYPSDYTACTCLFQTVFLWYTLLKNGSAFAEHSNLINC